MPRIAGISALTALLFTSALPTPLTAQTAPSVAESFVKPRIVITRTGSLRCEVAPTVIVGRSLSGRNAAASAPIQDCLQKRFGSAAAPVAPRRTLPTTPFILIGLGRDHALLRKLVADHKSEFPAAGLGDEGYILDVAPDRVLIAAAKPAGAFYGALRLRELAAGETGMDLPAQTVIDWPEMGWRGLHLLITTRAEMPLLESILTEYMPALRLNQFILEVDYHFQFKSHPEVVEGDALTAEDCRRLKADADKSYIRLIPMLNCLGHQSWADHTAQLLKAHPEFDETPEVPANNKGIYCRSWCPSNPDVNRVVVALIDELIDAFDAKAFHVGMDEVFLIGQCPRCKGKKNYGLFAKAVNDLHAHVVGKRRCEMLMWGDRLIDAKVTNNSRWEASANDTAAALDLIPKDIVFCDWHYGVSKKPPEAAYLSVAYFQSKGVRVWPSGWDTEANAQALTACSLHNRTKYMVGYLATTWMSVKGFYAGLSGDAKASRTAVNVSAAVRKGAHIAWEGLAGGS